MRIIRLIFEEWWRGPGFEGTPKGSLLEAFYGHRPLDRCMCCVVFAGLGVMILGIAMQIGLVILAVLS